MSEELITDIIDVPHVKGQFDDLGKRLAAMAEIVKTFPAIKIQIEGAGSLPGLSKGVQDLIKAQEKLDQSYTDYAKQMSLIKVQTEQRAADLKNEAKEELAAAGSIEQKRQTLSRLQKQYDQLSDSIRKSGEGKDLLKNIQSLDAEVKKLEASTGRFKSSVGNYGSVWDNFKNTGTKALDKLNGGFGDFIKNIAAAAISFLGIQQAFEFFKSSIESFEKAETNAARLENAIKNLGGSEKDVKALSLQVDDLSNKFKYLTKADITDIQEKLVKFGKLSTDQIKALTPVIIDFAANARIGVGEATDAILRGVEGNGRALKQYGINIKDAGSEAERFTLIQAELGRRVTGSGDVFQKTAEGQVAVYKKNIDDLKISIGAQLMPVYQDFLKGSISLIEVLKKIDFSLVIKGVALLTGAWLLYRGAIIAKNVAEVAGEIITKGMALATRLATAEVTLFNGAIKVSPLGIFLTMVGVGITLFTTFSASAANLAKSFDFAKEKSKELQDIQLEANKTFASQKSTIDQLVKTITDHNLKIGERKKALAELKSYDDNYLNSLTLENIETDKGKKLIDDYIASLNRKAIAEASNAKLGELAKEDLDTRIKQEKVVEQLNIEQEKLDKSTKNSYGEKFVDSYEVMAVYNLKDQLKQLNGEIVNNARNRKVLNDIIKEQGSSFAQFNGPGAGLSNGLDPTNKGEAAAAKRESELAERIRKAEFDLQKLHFKDEEELNKAIAEDQSKSFQVRLLAAEKYSEAKGNLINLEEKETIRVAKTGKEKELALVIAASESAKNQQDYSTLTAKIIADNAKKSKEAWDKAYKDIVAASKLALEAQNIAANKRKQDEEFQLLKDFSNGKIASEEEYQQRKQLIQEKYDQEEIGRKIKHEMELFTLNALLGKSNNDQIKNLLDLQLKNQDNAAKKEIEIEKLLFQSKKDLIDKEKALKKEAASFIVQMFTSQIDKQLSALDDQGKAIDANKQKEIDAINASTLAAADKQARISTIEKQAAFDHQKIEDQKAILEKKKKQVEKVSNIATILGDTAKSVFDLTAKAAAAKAQAALLAANPLTAAYAPIAIAAAGAIAAEIPFVLASSALQLAKVSFFKKGTKNAPKGLAVVGEEGSELMSKDGKMFLSPPKPTLMNLAGGEQITPAHLTKDILNSIGFVQTMAMTGFTQLNAKGMSEKQADVLISEIRDLKGISARSRVLIHNEAGIESTPYYMKNIKH